MVKKLRWLCTLTLVFALTLVLPGQTLAAESNRSPEFQRVIVMFYDFVDPVPASAELAMEHGLALGHVYQSAIKGFSCSVPTGRLAALKADPRVKLVEPDLIAHTTEQIVPTGVDRIEADLNNIADIDGQDDQRVDVDIAIIDTGIDIDHPDLNVVGGRHFYSLLYEDGNYDDDNGHGTHVAGIAAALDNDIGVVGVAPGARLWAVKVLNASGSGYLSDIAAGVDYVTEHANEIEVANMSLRWVGNSTVIRSAISASISAGVVYVVAAGNESQDIYGSDGIPYTNDDIQPAAYAEVATISAMADYDGIPGGEGGSTNYGADDSFASFSNFSGYDYIPNLVDSPGLGIDLMIPGVNIYSTYKNGGYATMSGTSMASPHAAGLVALYITENGRATNMLTVAFLRQALVDAGMPQSDDQNGLTNLNDPDNNEEPIGWAESSGAPVNNPPTFDSNPIVETAATEDSPYGSTIADDASDLDGDTLSFSKLSGPAWLTVGSDGALSGTPFNADVGLNSWVVKVEDGNGGSDQATLEIIVNNTNDAPTFTSNPIVEADAIVDVPYSSTIADDASDPDTDDTLSFSKIDGPDWLTVASDGTLSGTPTTLGLGTWTIQVSDGNGETAQAMLNITVKEPYFYATQDVFIQNGGVTGSYHSTLDSDDNYEGIRERESDGNPSKRRYSYLEHKWIIPVTGGLQTYIFNIEAYHTANTEGDDFVFAYSTDDVDYTDMVLITETSDNDQCQTFVIQEATSGSVYIRVTDTDQTSGNRTLDTIYIDRMYIEGNGTPLPNNPPDAPDVLEPENGAIGTNINPVLSVYVSDPDGDTMNVTFYDGSGIIIGIDDGVLSGTQASIQWLGLSYNTEYRWYAVADDGEDTSTSGTWSFTTGSEPQSGGMYVWDINWASAGINLKSSVMIRCDSDGDGVAESSDEPIVGATVYYTLTNDGGASQDYIAITDASGQISVQWKKAPPGSYVGLVNDITLDGYEYTPELDCYNPAPYAF